MNAPRKSVARANSALRDLRRADQSREGASPSWQIPYTAWCWRNPRNSKWPISKTGSATSTAPIGDFVHTITFDNGKEFAAHQDIAHACLLYTSDAADE